MRLVRLSAVMAGVLAGSLGAAAWAAPPVEMRSESQRVGVPTLLSEPRAAGNTTHVTFEETLFLSGDLESTPGVPAVSRLDCVYVGSKFVSCHGEQIFTGTVEGVDGAGTTTSKVHFKCSLTTFECTGSATITDSTGGLAGVRGHSTFTANLISGHGFVVSRVVLP